MDVPVWGFVIGSVATVLVSFGLGALLAYAWRHSRTRELGEVHRQFPPAKVDSSVDLSVEDLRELSVTERGYWRHLDGSECVSHPDSFRFSYIARAHQCSHGTLLCYRAEELSLLNELRSRGSLGGPENPAPE